MAGSLRTQFCGLGLDPVIFGLTVYRVFLHKKCVNKPTGSFAVLFTHHLGAYLSVHRPLLSDHWKISVVVSRTVYGRHVLRLLTDCLVSLLQVQ